MKLQDTSFARDGRSLLEVLGNLAEQGWSEQATALEGGLMRCGVCGQPTPADELVVEALHRIEGASDPDEMAMVVATTCPHCDAHVALVLTYGPEASSADADVLVALQEPAS